MAYNMNAAAVTPSSDVSRFLEPGERIVWQGQPGRAGIVNGLQLAGFIVLGVGTFLAVVFMILGITLSGSRQEFNRGGDLGAFLWVGLIIFIVADSVGLILVFTGRVAGGTSKINYIITDRHALITQGPSYNTIRTTIIDLADISIIRLLEGKNGTGSIIFGRSGYNNSVSYNATPSYYDRDYSFVAIADVLSVYNLLRQQQAGLNKQQA